MQLFDELGVTPELVDALAAEGIEVPTEFQSAAIPVLLRGNPLLAQAGPGAGTLIAYGVPLLQRVEPDALAPRAVILASSVEAASRLAGSLSRLAVARSTLTPCPCPIPCPYSCQSESHEFVFRRSSRNLVRRIEPSAARCHREAAHPSTDAYARQRCSMSLSALRVTGVYAIARQSTCLQRQDRKKDGFSRSPPHTTSWLIRHLAHARTEHSSSCAPAARIRRFLR